MLQHSLLNRIRALLPNLMKKSSIFIEVKNYFLAFLIGVAIKKYKISNLMAIFILLAADLGIGYFTLPYAFNMSNAWGIVFHLLIRLYSKFYANFQLCLWPLLMLSINLNL